MDLCCLDNEISQACQLSYKLLSSLSDHMGSHMVWYSEHMYPIPKNTVLIKSTVCTLHEKSFAVVISSISSCLFDSPSCILDEAWTLTCDFVMWHAQIPTLTTFCLSTQAICCFTGSCTSNTGATWCWVVRIRQTLHARSSEQLISSRASSSSYTQHWM